jgi:hypothetical protein
MAAESKKEIGLEIAHVLFLDIVGYSKLSVNQQHAAVEELSQSSSRSSRLARHIISPRIEQGPKAPPLPKSPSRCCRSKI